MSDEEKQSLDIKGRGGKRPGAGRPLGSPNKLTRPLKEAAALESEACLNTLIRLRDHAESEQVRLAAAQAILDRGFGKPRQGLDLTKDHGITVIVDPFGYRRKQSAMQPDEAKGPAALPGHAE